MCRRKDRAKSTTSDQDSYAQMSGKAGQRGGAPTGMCTMVHLLNQSSTKLPKSAMPLWSPD